MFVEDLGFDSSHAAVVLAVPGMKKAGHGRALMCGHFTVRGDVGGPNSRLPFGRPAASAKHGASCTVAVAASAKRCVLLGEGGGQTMPAVSASASCISHQRDARHPFRVGLRIFGFDSFESFERHLGRLHGARVTSAWPRLRCAVVHNPGDGSLVTWLHRKLRWKRNPVKNKKTCSCASMP